MQQFELANVIYIQEGGVEKCFWILINPPAFLTLRTGPAQSNGSKSVFLMKTVCTLLYSIS